MGSLARYDLLVNVRHRGLSVAVTDPGIPAKHDKGPPYRGTVDSVVRPLTTGRKTSQPALDHCRPMPECGVETGGFAENPGTSGANSPRCRAIPRGLPVGRMFVSGVRRASGVLIRVGGQVCRLVQTVDKSDFMTAAVAVAGVASFGALRHSASACWGWFLEFCHFSSFLLFSIF